MSAQEIFLRQVAARTEEHKKAFTLLYEAGHFGVCIGIVRQEIDSMLRVAYLWEPETTTSHALELIESSVSKGEWKVTNNKGKLVRVTDREMLDCPLTNGWEATAYDFGCRLIHLSNAHAYQTLDPTLTIPTEQRAAIAAHLNFYHQFPGEDVTMQDVIAYLPRVFQKVYENTELYVEELREKLAVGGDGL